MDLSVIINSIQAAINSAPITANPSIAVKEALSESLTRCLRHVKNGGIEYNLSNVLTDSHDGFNDKCDYMHMGKDVILSMNSSNRFIGGFINGNNLDLRLTV